MESDSPTRGTVEYIKWRADRDGLDPEKVIALWNDAYLAGWEAHRRASAPDLAHE